MWNYREGRVLSQGGLSQNLSLAIVFEGAKFSGGGRQNDPGTWKTILCNQGGTSSSTAEQEWVFPGDGTIRLRNDRSRCLAPCKVLSGASQEVGLTVLSYDRAKHGFLSWLIGFNTSDHISLENKFLGCILGLTVGDALGSGFEGWASSEIAIMHPFGIREFSARRDLQQANANLRPGAFTDRTVMALAVAASLAEMRGCVPEHVVQRSAEFFAVKAINGHAAIFGSAAPMLQDMIRDVPGRAAWPAASFDGFDPVALAFDGCGACYRAPPLGLAFCSRPDEELREHVCGGVLSAYGDYEAAFMVAKAVALLAQEPSVALFDPRRFLVALRESMQGVVDQPMSLGYKVACNREAGHGVWPRTDGQQPSTAPDHWYVTCLDSILAALPSADAGLDDASLRKVEDSLNFPARHQQTSPFPGRAVDTVPVALWGFVLRWETPREGLAHVLRCGGDTATVGAVSGALFGALHGPQWLARAWWDQLENGLHGRDFAARTARQLAAVFAAAHEAS